MAELVPLRKPVTPKRYGRVLKTERVPVRYSPLEKVRLRRIARAQGTSLAGLIRSATLPLIDGGRRGARP